MIGRERELARLRAALDELQAGAAAVVAVAGEPGIGKSRLLRALREDAGARGCLVLSGRAAEFEREAPYGALVDALDTHLRTLDDTRLRGLDHQQLARIFPALEHEAPQAPMLAAERYRTHRAVLELLARLAATRPLVLTLDDVHDADPALLELLVALLRRAPEARVLVAIALRSAQIPALLAEALNGAQRDGTVVRLDLGPLDPGDALELIGPDVPPAQRDAVLRESGGNPFYLEQLVRAGAGQRAAADDRDRGDPGRAAGARRARAAPARGRGGGGRPVRAGARRRGGAARRRRGARAARRAAGGGLRARDPRAARVRVPAPARAPRGLRERGRRLAARRPRAGGGGAGEPRRGARAARPPRPVLGPSRGRGRDRAAARGRRRRAPADARHRARAGTPPRCGCCPAPTRSAGARCWRTWRAPSPPPAGWRRAGARCSRRSCWPRTAARPSTCGWSRAARPPSTGSAATRTRAGGCWPRCTRSATRPRCCSSSRSTRCTGSTWRRARRGPSRRWRTPTALTRATAAALLSLVRAADGRHEQAERARDAALAADRAAARPGARRAAGGALVPGVGGDVPRPLRRGAGARAARARAQPRDRPGPADRAARALLGLPAGDAGADRRGARGGRGRRRRRAAVGQPPPPLLGAVGVRADALVRRRQRAARGSRWRRAACWPTRPGATCCGSPSPAGRWRRSWPTRATSARA